MKNSFQTRRILIWVASILAVVAITVLIWNSTAPTVVIPPLPNPNGYDDFVAAGNQLPSLSWEDLKPDELKSALATNQPAFALVRVGLSKKSQAPIDFSEKYFLNQLTNLSEFKQLARALTASGKMAETEGRFDDAADDYATTIALGIESARGGDLVNGLVRFAVASIGVKGLQSIIPKLSRTSSQHALGVIEKAEVDGDTCVQTLAMDEYFYEHSPFLQRAYIFILRLVGNDITAQSNARFRTKFQTSQRSILILEGQLASHAFELQKGRPATNWNDLVPTYLPAIPSDPTATNQPMKFPAL